MTQPHQAKKVARVFDYAALLPEPWVNGKGVTRTVARGVDANGATTWRVSLAEWNHAAPFSLFPGFDRTLLTIDDGCIDLHSKTGQLIARPEQPVCFSGEMPIWVSRPLTAARVVNVMTRRNAHRTTVTVVKHAADVSLASVQVLICVEGAWSIESKFLHEMTLSPLSGVFLEGQQEPLNLKPDGTGARLVSIAIDSLTG